MSAAAQRPAWPLAMRGALCEDGSVQLGRAVRDARREHRWSQGVLAQRLDVARETVGTLERGGRVNPRLALVVAIAATLRVEIAMLVGAFVGQSAEPESDVDRGGVVGVRLRETGSRGMGLAFRAFRTDLGASVSATAARAAGGRGFLNRFEAGAVASPGLLTVVRLAGAIDPEDVELRRTTRRVGLLVAVYAGELTAYDAIALHRSALT